MREFDRLIHDSIMASAIHTEREIARAFLDGEPYYDQAINFGGTSHGYTRYILTVPWWNVRRRRTLTKIAKATLAR